jgi:hypothetical protein
MIQDCVIDEYYQEIERAKQPGYISRYDDFDFEFGDAPRSRPQRFDPPHLHAPGDHPRGSPKSPPSSDSAANKPHQRGRDSSNEGNRPTGTDSFGAGIFPE